MAPSGSDGQRPGRKIIVEKPTKKRCGDQSLASDPGREPHPHPVPMRNALFPLPIDEEGAGGEVSPFSRLDGWQHSAPDGRTTTRTDPAQGAVFFQAYRGRRGRGGSGSKDERRGQRGRPLACLLLYQEGWPSLKQTF